MHGIAKKMECRVGGMISTFHNAHKPFRDAYTDTECINYQKKLYNICGGKKEPDENEEAIVRHIANETQIDKAKK